MATTGWRGRLRTRFARRAVERAMDEEMRRKLLARFDDRAVHYEVRHRPQREAT